MLIYMVGTPITFRQGAWQVPDDPIIPYVSGDGSGPDIWRATQRVMDQAVVCAYGDSRKIHWQELVAGQRAFNETGEWLPKPTVDMMEQHPILLKGPLTAPVGGGIKSLNVALRYTLDLHTRVRPLQAIPGFPTFIQTPHPIDLTLFREHSEGLFAGIEAPSGSEKSEKMLAFLQAEYPDDYAKVRFASTEEAAKLLEEQGVREEPRVEVALDWKPISRLGAERLVRMAISYALQHGRKSLTLLHKGNAMKLTEGAFRDWGYALAEREFGERIYSWATYHRTAAAKGREVAMAEYKAAMQAGKLEIKDSLVDIFFPQLLANSQNFDVVVALNLTGDFVSETLTAMLGAKGLLPRANVNGTTGRALFEGTQGTSPRLAGTDRVNPVSLILAGQMMLHHLGWEEPAQLIQLGLASAMRQSIITPDLARRFAGHRTVSTTEFADAICAGMIQTSASH
ncbi:isocitrate/isopropylmalate family dehydrogenase [Pontibacter sp. G13]|uniref:isocitrate/isopropylmalate family dehydrogenase n=1 Tax=Pontibacter sp. G13 TaxID=3074898 RepID=UPI00288AFD8F|nr:isocitrate/isopropylmalate family dehydrogenase [Pontibacter sp. G13]WNJ21029.1 isocitrate/isopropylmalate family dehydrogenase [Pontibacter sp. G13]